MRRSLGWALVLLLGLVPGAWAQISTGNVYGTVVDESGAVLPGATIGLGMPDADPNGAMILAQVYLRRSQAVSALDALEKVRVPALGRKPIAGFDFLRGDVLARLHRYAEAEAAFREEIRAFPRNAQAYASQAVVLALEGRSQAEVHGVLDSMVRASPTRETILLAAKTLEFMGDAEGARAWRHRAAPPSRRP
jgi:hypothetical protein